MWVSVDERLPAVGQDVDILTEKGRKIDCVYMGGGDFTDKEGYFFDERVTHWQPLPAPPGTPSVVDGVVEALEEIKRLGTEPPGGLHKAMSLAIKMRDVADAALQRLKGE
jgi:hypothetical protein